MLNIKNNGDEKKAYQYVQSRVNNYYLSAEYGRAWDRYVVRWKAFHRRPLATAPKWRSQLYFASYFVAVQALDAQFKAAHSTEPFVHVSVKDKSMADQEALLLAQVQHFDLDYDLHASNFKKKQFDMYWYVGIFGTAVAREYIRTKQNVKNRRQRVKNQFGISMPATDTQEIDRTEYTATQVIHPLNFGHEITKNYFGDSEWGTVRFELQVTELYKMRGNDNYYQPGVKKAIKAWEEGDGLGFVVGQTTFYSERGNDDQEQRKNTIVVNEYSGPIRCKGNRDDSTLYYYLYIESINVTLALKPSPFTGHPYWKEMTNPEPDGPYGIGANDSILPINYWENSTINQYNDYMNSSLKYMYEIQPRNIIGGVNTLINGLPNGLIPLEEGIAPGQSIRNLDLNRGQMPAVESIIQMIEKAKNQYGSSSNLRGRDQGSNADTATGISLLAKREDDTIAALQDTIDMGIKRGMFIKIRNQHEFFTEEKRANAIYNGEEVIIPHYPYDLGGLDYTFDIKRELGDTAAGKHMSWLRLITQVDQTLTQKGAPLQPKFLIDALKAVGTALDINGIDELSKQLESAVPAPPQIGPAGPVPPGATPPQAPQPAQPEPQLPQEAINATALA